MFRALCQSISDRIPGQCAVCRCWPSNPVCDTCVALFAQPCPRCITCAIAVNAAVRQCGACIRQPPPLDACVAGLHYAYPWSELIVRFKFRQQPGWAHTLALLLRSAPWVEPELEQADRVVPMPLSTQRLRQRGFNQALELARHLAPEKLSTELLLRIRDTAAQSALGREQRMRNVRDAFAVEPLRRGELVGARVVLVDDVMTSGASLFAAAAALRQAGARHVTGMVLARADRPGDTPA
ncbi:MAG: phosphoribosyltransferase family protein [Betaproteobacteria bacterium]